MSRNGFGLIVNDVKDVYVNYRKSGKNRSETVRTIYNEYKAELKDYDDRIAVLIGLSLALCNKNEMLPFVAADTLKEIDIIKHGRDLDLSLRKCLEKVEQKLADKSIYGEEAPYQRKRVYTPDWHIGDVLAHEIACPMGYKLGISGWFILLYKVGDHIDQFGGCSQLMYVSLCPPDRIPVSAQDLMELGFMEMFPSDKHTDYLAQMTVKSKRAENSFGLSKIASFPNMELPSDPSKENPLTARLLLGKLRKGECHPAYEEEICLLISWAKRLKYNIRLPNCLQ